MNSLSPHPGLRRSGTQRGRRSPHQPVGSWRSISRCWRRTPPAAAPTSPAGCWGCGPPPGCSPALNYTLTQETDREQVQKSPRSTLTHHLHSQSHEKLLTTTEGWPEIHRQEAPSAGRPPSASTCDNQQTLTSHDLMVKWAVILILIRDCACGPPQQNQPDSASSPNTSCFYNLSVSGL